MKHGGFAILLFLVMSLAVAGTVQAAGGVHGPGDRVMDLPAASGSVDRSPAQAVPAREICPDIASTPKFRAFGLGYLHTLEFSDSIDAVANGTSKHSPSRIPAGWKDAAREWRIHIATGGASGVLVNPAVTEEVFREDSGRDGTLLGENDCASSLIYRASLDYRARHGSPNLNLAYPYAVRAAVPQLNEMVVVKREAADRLAHRASETAYRVAMAEMLGAAQCQPDDLARVKFGLWEAIRAATDIHYGVAETEEIFARMERASEALLTQRRYAISRGVPCLSR
jgi:hypothetical protein